jgi:hypothetical protein
VKRVEYLMEIFKLVVNFLYMLITGIAFVGYNLFFIEKNKIVFIIFLSIGMFLLIMLLIVLKNINQKILENIKE